MKVGLCGLGRAGREFVRYFVEKRNEDLLVAVLCRESSPTAGHTVSEVTGIVTEREITIQRISAFQPSIVPDVIVDFSACTTSLELLELCCRMHINCVICPTDFTAEQLSLIQKKAISNRIGIVYAPALTFGINVLISFVKWFSQYSLDYQFEIIEKHPHNKLFPTRTARYIANAIAREKVPIASIRLDGYTGIHEVIATDGYECLSITHESFSRLAFVRGALMAARFIQGKSGYFVINDIISQIFTNKA